ncbi:MAG: hypothetical protein D6766_10935, partial [Verrucomicrobia bacterium]
MKARFWSILSLLCFLGAIGFWLAGERRSREEATARAAARAAAPASGSPAASAAGSRTQLLSRAALRQQRPVRATTAAANHSPAASAA